jgi:hypothetical protein
MSKAVVGLPRWQSHKKVYGDRIKGIERLDPKVGWGRDDTGLRWLLDCGVIVSVTKDLIARGSPTAGDYFIQYDDGYKSWSPAKAFEEGYTRISE